MKTSIKKILFVAVMFGTLLGYAKENAELSKSIEVDRVKIEFNSVKKGQNLTIKSENGITIYKSEIKNNGTFSKLFDFTALKNGNYSAELNKDFEIVIKSFSIKDGLVTFSKENTSKIFKPVIRVKEDLVMISKINYDKKDIKVSLYYEGDNLLNETLSGKKILKRVYKLSKNYTGDYKVVIKANNRVYIKNFTI